MRKSLAEKIEMVPFPADQYNQEEWTKKQIVLHHTGSGPSARGDIGTWKATPTPIATCGIIEHDGTFKQLFSSKFWAWGLGIGKQSNRISPGLKKNYMACEMHSIQIEIDSWGVLKFDQEIREYKSWTGQVVPIENVIQYPKDYKTRHAGLAFERYTFDQIDTVLDLIDYWRDLYHIPVNLQDDPLEIFDISERALKLEPGVYTHNSYVTANLRNDIHPQPELIAGLMDLNNR